MILTRYLAKDVLLNTAAVTLVLMLVALANQFVVFLSRAAEGEIPVGLVLEVVALNLPYWLSFLLPFGFFLGVLLAYGRLYTETEMTVMQACGFSISRLVWTTLNVGFGMAILCAILTLWTAPASQFRLDYLYAHVRADVLANFIKSGQFQSWEDGHYVIYIGSIDEQQAAVKQIFIAEQPESAESSERLSVLTGTSGSLWTDPNTDVEYIVLKNGKRYLGEPGNASYSLMDFEEYGIRLPTHTPTIRERERAQTTPSLFNKLEDPEVTAELQWRFTLPISILVVAILSVPLSRVPPRKGRFYAIFPAMTVMLFYTLSLMLTKTWVKEAIMPAWLGLIWPHLIALGFAGYLLAKQTHFFKQLQRRL